MGVAEVGYTRGEVVWLLSLTRDQAIDLDAYGRDSCAGLSDDDIHGDGAAEDDPIPVIARWTDVQRAKRNIVTGKDGLAIMQLRAGGYSESEIARLAGRGRLAVRRRWHTTVDEILDELGGEAQPLMALSHLSMCLTCGERPRARLAAVKRRVRGGWKIIQEERQASVCAECLSPEFALRKVEERSAAA